MKFFQHLERFFTRGAPVARGERLLVAYSGGIDSTALLWGLSRVAASLELDLRAVHVDHGLDGDSGRRADAARRSCDVLQVPMRIARHSVANEARSGESLEVAARRVRYVSLEAERRRTRSRWVVTAHHADDQVETVLLRLLYGSGINGLAGVRERQGRVVRPLLCFTRCDLQEVVDASGLRPVVDPSNLRLDVPRNRVRHLVWPTLREQEAELDEQIVRLAATAERFRRGLENRLRSLLSLRVLPEAIEIDHRRLQALSGELWPFVLALLHREARLPYPPSRSARLELWRQLAGNKRVGCDCGSGWRWESDGRRLRLCRTAPTAPAFAYTLEVPGECKLPEISLTFRLRRGAVAAWMFRHSESRAGLALPLAAGDHVVIRSRMPGDRVHPFGCPYSRRLKDVLIDRRVPRRLRDRLPLLEVASRVAWVPGVTIDDSFRVGVDEEAWIAELEPFRK